MASKADLGKAGSYRPTTTHQNSTYPYNDTLCLYPSQNPFSSSRIYDDTFTQVNTNDALQICYLHQSQHLSPQYLESHNVQTRGTESCGTMIDVASSCGRDRDREYCLGSINDVRDIDQLLSSEGYHNALVCVEKPLPSNNYSQSTGAQRERLAGSRRTFSSRPSNPISPFFVSSREMITSTGSNDTLNSFDHNQIIDSGNLPTSLCLASTTWDPWPSLQSEENTELNGQLLAPFTYRYTPDQIQPDDQIIQKPWTDLNSSNLDLPWNTPPMVVGYGNGNEQSFGTGPLLSDVPDTVSARSDFAAFDSKSNAFAYWDLLMCARDMRYILC